MLCVSVVTLVSCLLIIMLERVKMIGILKSLGACHFSIKRIFTNFILIIIGKGVFIGNLIAISACYLQKYYSIVDLDSSIYYINSVPVELNWLYIIGVDMLIIAVSFFIVLCVTYFVSINKPIHAIRFE